jgi:hypothetical protein
MILLMNRTTTDAHVSEPQLILPIISSGNGSKTTTDGSL